MPEQTYFDASVSILVGAAGLKWTITGAVVSFLLSSSNARCSLSVHSHLPSYFFCVLSYNGFAVLLNPSMNRRERLQNPKKLCMLVLFFGVFQSHMACVLTGSVLIPSRLMMNPRYSVSSLWNSHFEGLTFIPDFCMAL